MSEKINDGGPAFPRPATETQNPNMFHPPQSGMSLRDYFAGQALAACVAKFPEMQADNAAHWAYQFADAMLRARGGGNG